MKTICYLMLFVLCGFSSFIGNAYCGGTKFEANELNLYGKTLQNLNVEVKIASADYSASIPYRNGFRWGAEIRAPRKIITSIEVKIDKRDVFIPISAYCDLADPQSASLKMINEGMEIVIEGGDASTSYIATLQIIKSYIKSREVKHREFPKVAWEKTIYSFNTGQ